jgi:hypothetical protein
MQFITCFSLFIYNYYWIINVAFDESVEESNVEARLTAYENQAYISDIIICKLHDYRLYSKSSLTLNEWKFNLMSFS